MTIQLKPQQESRIDQAIRSGAYPNPEELIEQALEMLHERDEWLSENRSLIEEKIQHGVDQLGRGEGIMDDDLEEYLTRMKADLA